MSRAYSYLLIIFGALTLFFGVVWLHWPLLVRFQSTFINVYPVPPAPSQYCSGVLVPFPYPWSCPPNYESLPSPLDTFPLLPVTYFAVGGVAIWSAFAQRLRHKALTLSLSIGLVATALGSNVGYLGNQGWPINWFLYPISHPPFSNYFPVYIVVPAFLANWALFSSAIGIVLVWILPYLSKTLRQK